VALTAVFFALGGQLRTTEVGILVALAFFAATFSAWRDKYQECEALGKKISEDEVRHAAELDDARAKCRPELAGQIECVAHYNLQKSPEKDRGTEGITILFLQVTIRNVGSPSIVRDWMLSVEHTNKEVARLLPHKLSVMASLIAEAGATGTDFRDGEEIYEKTTEPIVTGGMKSGWIAFLCPFPSVPGGSKLTIGYSDVFGRTYSVYSIVKGASDPVMYYPGTNQPFLGVKKWGGDRASV